MYTGFKSLFKSIWKSYAKIRVFHIRPDPRQFWKSLEIIEIVGNKEGQLKEGHWKASQYHPPPHTLPLSAAWGGS